MKTILKNLATICVLTSAVCVLLTAACTGSNMAATTSPDETIAAANTNNKTTGASQRTAAKPAPKPVVQTDKATITEQKRTYKRTNPEAPEHKKTFVVTRPLVSGLGDAALEKKIQTTISHEKSFEELSIAEQLKDDWWLDELSYEVGYNDNSILAVNLLMDGSAAYPTQGNKAVVVNLKTGDKVTAKDVFNPAKLDELQAKIKTAMEKQFAAARADAIKNANNDITAEQFDEFAVSTEYTVENTNDFTLDDKGVTFRYDYGFPHVAQALEPDGRFFYSYAELKPFLKSDGLLGQFAK